MKSEDKDFDINEVAIALEVDSDVIGKVRSGKVTHIALQINENNQNMILENIDGHLELGMANPSWKTQTVTVVYGK